MSIEFFVPGLAKTAGSKKHVGNGILVDDSGDKGKRWREDVKVFARQAYQGPPLEGALHIKCVFLMRRPAGHWKKDGTLRPWAPRSHTKKPDTTKMFRAVEDALTGILWNDDAQIEHQELTKRYADREQPGVFVRLVQSPK